MGALGRPGVGGLQEFLKMCVCGLSMVSRFTGKKHDWTGLWSGARSESEEWGLSLQEGRCRSWGRGRYPHPIT